MGDIYRQLQKHLDRQPVGFPRTRSGADLRLLKTLFTPEEALLALGLTHKPTALPLILQRLAPGQAPAQVEQQLDAMFMKGAIGRRERNGIHNWHLMPLVVGMFEAQLGTLNRRFVTASAMYMRTLSFGRSLLAAKPSQMRTIPVNKSIPIEQAIATYDHVRGLIDDSEGPFAILPCICRKLTAMKQQPCEQTSRTESCLAIGETATMMLQRGNGREVTREETLSILEANEHDGLVLQPSNTQRAEFVCSCCGCCCGMLGMQKKLPRPLDFWTSNFYAEIESPDCIGCGKCVARCQVGAVSLKEQGGTAIVDLNRCIGCGLCVPTCPTKAMHLVEKARPVVPPENEEALYDLIKANKKNALGQVVMLLKVALQARLRK